MTDNMVSRNATYSIGDLAREFERLARATPSRERLGEILLECLLARHLGR